MNNYQVLTVFIINISLRIIGTFTSSLLLVTSCKSRLIKKPGLYLIHMLIFFDLIYFVLGLPQLIYSLVFWDDDYLSYNPAIIFFTGIPVVFHDKNEFTLLLTIAVDRLLAVYFPAYYQLINHKYKAVLVSGLSIAAGCIDVYLFYSMSPEIERPGCAALGCFMGDTFRGYLGLSNGICGLLLMLLTVVLVHKVKLISSIYVASNKSRDQLNFLQANKTALISLFTCGLLVTVPAIIMGFFQKIVGDLIKNIGPLMSILILTAGILNSLTLLIRNKEFNKALRVLLANRVFSQVMVTPIPQLQSNPTDQNNGPPLKF